MLSKSQKLIILFIAVLSFLSALFYNELNLSYIRSDIDNGLRHDETIALSDDFSYITPPENYLKTGVWKDNTPGKQSFFMRPPGYGLFYMVFLYIADAPYLLKLLKYCQLLLFALSVYCFFFIANNLIKNYRFSLVTTAIYGITPFATGFLYNTLTEGITPALTIFYLYSLIAAGQSNHRNKKFLLYIVASGIFAYLFITRPVLGILGIILPFFLFRDYYQKGKIFLLLRNIFICGIICASLMVLWQIRSYMITGRYVGLHPVYYPEMNSEFRPTHKHIWEFAKGWGEEGAAFHGYMVPLWRNAIKGDTSSLYVKNIVRSIPGYVTGHFGEERLTDAFRDYQASILYQKKFYDKGQPMPGGIPDIEKDVISIFHDLKKEFKSEFWLQYHVISPFVVFKRMAFHSNLSLYIFQGPFRGNIIMEIVRVIFFVIHSLIFIFFVFNIFFLKDHVLKSAFVYSLLIYIFYLVYFQGGIEERYTLPVLPILFISSSYALREIFSRIRKG